MTCAIKPCCEAFISSYLLKCRTILSRMMDSINLQIQVRETGRQLPAAIREPDLKIGVMLPILQSSGTTPSSIDFLNTMARGAHKMSAVAWRTQGPILSGPKAESGLSFYFILFKRNSQENLCDPVSLEGRKEYSGKEFVQNIGHTNIVRHHLITILQRTNTWLIFHLWPEVGIEHFWLLFRFFRQLPFKLLLSFMQNLGSKKW